MDTINTLTAVNHLAEEFVKLKYSGETPHNKDGTDIVLSNSGLSDVVELLKSLRAKVEMEQCATSGDKKRLTAIKAFAKQVIKTNPNPNMKGVIKDTITQQDMLMNSGMAVRFNNPLPPSIPRPDVDGGTFDLGRIIPNENVWEGKVSVVALEQLLKERKALVKAGTLPKESMNREVFSFPKSDIIIMVNLENLVLAARCIEDDERKVGMSITGELRPIILNTYNGTAMVMPMRLAQTNEPIVPDYIIDGE